jgi:hypothetical protein
MVSDVSIHGRDPNAVGSAERQHIVVDRSGGMSCLYYRNQESKGGRKRGWLLTMGIHTSNDLKPPHLLRFSPTANRVKLETKPLIK